RRLSGQAFTDASLRARTGAALARAQPLRLRRPPRPERGGDDIARTREGDLTAWGAPGAPQTPDARGAPAGPWPPRITGCARGGIDGGELRPGTARAAERYGGDRRCGGERLPEGLPGRRRPGRGRRGGA